MTKQTESSNNDLVEWHAIRGYNPGSEIPTTYYGWGDTNEVRKFVRIMTRRHPDVMYTWERLGNEEGFHPEDSFNKEDEMWILNT